MIQTEEMFPQKILKPEKKASEGAAQEPYGWVEFFLFQELHQDDGDKADDDASDCRLVTGVSD